MKRVVEDTHNVTKVSELKDSPIIGIMDEYNNKYILVKECNTYKVVIVTEKYMLNIVGVKAYKGSLKDVLNYCLGNGETIYEFDTNAELMQWAFGIPQSTDSVDEVDAVEEKQTEHKYWCLNIFYSTVEKGSIFIKTPSNIEEDEVADYAHDFMIIDDYDYEHVSSVEEVDYKTYKYFTYC